MKPQCLQADGTLKWLPLWGNSIRHRVNGMWQMAYTSRSLISSFSMAATFIHEFLHICNPAASERQAEGAVLACGLPTYY